MGYSEGTEYLCVDAFIKGVVEARALETAFETGLIDLLIEKRPLAQGEIEEHLNADERGASMLVGLLRSNNVIVEQGGRILLSEAFIKALRYRDLLRRNWNLHTSFSLTLQTSLHRWSSIPIAFFEAPVPSTCFHTVRPWNTAPRITS